MEIKVQCDCGQKFKFDVEPVDGRMPFAVNCPVCGADGTAQANVLLQQMPPPPRVAAPPPAPMRPAGLSINRPHAAPPPALAPVAAGEETTSEDDDDSAGEGGVHVVKLGWKVWGMIILFVCLGLVGSFDKWSRRITAVKELVTWVKGLAGGDTEGAAADESKPILFSQGESTLLFRHENQQEVAAACAEFWSAQYNQKLHLSAPTNCTPVEAIFLFGEEAVAVVLPGTNGEVELVAPLEANDKSRAALSALAESVSRKLHCTNVCAFLGEDFATGTFIVHDSGTPRFRCDRTLTTIGKLEKVKVDGENWAKEIGFKPSKAGFNGFTLEDAEALTKHLGFQPVPWDKPVPCIVLSTKSGAL